MPSTLNGTGTTFYGNRDKDIGGTYITTKWITILWVPIIPLSSWRVYMRGDEQALVHGVRNEQYFEATRLPLNWRQVLNVYLLSALGLTAAWYLLIQPVLFR